MIIVCLVNLDNTDNKGLVVQTLSYRSPAIAVSLSLLFSVTACMKPEAPDTYRHADEPIGTVREVYDGRLYPDVQVNTFRNIDRLFPTRIVRRGTGIRELPLSPEPLGEFSYTDNGKTYDLFDVLSLNRVSGLLIIKDDAIVFEK